MSIDTRPELSIIFFPGIRQISDFRILQSLVFPGGKHILFSEAKKRYRKASDLVSKQILELVLLAS